MFTIRPPSTTCSEACLADFALYEDDLRREPDGQWRFVKRSYRVVYFDTSRPAGDTWPAPFTDSTF
jgi:hypothetical protein